MEATRRTTQYKLVEGAVIEEVDSPERDESPIAARKSIGTKVVTNTYSTKIGFSNDGTR